MDLNDLAAAALRDSGDVVQASTSTGKSHGQDTSQKRYPTRRRSTASTAPVSRSSAASTRTASRGAGKSVAQRTKKKENAVASPAGAAYQYWEMSAIAGQADVAGGIFNNDGNQIGFSVPSTSNSAFEAHLPMPAYGSSALQRSNSNSSTSTTVEGAPGSSSAADIGVYSSTRHLEPHMSDMSTSNTLVSSGNASGSSSAALPPLLPPMPQAIPPYKRMREEDEYEDYHNLPAPSIDYNGIDPEVAALVPPRKQKGRRPNVVPSDGKTHKCSFTGCSWTFSRKEHLKRHEKTHTQERPFECDVPHCGLRFSRLDNLNSHKRTHEKGKRTAQWHVAKLNGSGYYNDGLDMGYSDGGSMSPYEDLYAGAHAHADIDVPALPPLPPSHSLDPAHLPNPTGQYNESMLQQQVDALLRAGNVPPITSPTSTTSGSSGQVGSANAASLAKTRAVPAAAPVPDPYEDDLTDEEENLYNR